MTFTYTSRHRLWMVTLVEQSAAVTLLEGSVKDEQLVTPEGEVLTAEIDGVLFRAATTHADELGSITEIYSVGWNFKNAPVVHVYQTTVQPGRVKGWIVHALQDDRLHFANGCAKVALYDARAGSLTEGVVSVRFLGADQRGLIVIPAGVYHAVRNVGTEILTFINLPTRAYDHENPDKYRLPVDSPQIPYRP